MTLTLRAGAMPPTASRQDVARQDALQTRRFMLNGEVNAQGGIVRHYTVKCEVKRLTFRVIDLNVFPASGFPDLRPGTPATFQQPIVFTTPVPAGDAPVEVSCQASGTNAQDGPVSATAGTTVQIGDTSGAPDSCTANAQTGCVGNRFKVQTTFQDFSGRTGDATLMPSSSGSDLLWFFQDSRQLELVVRILDSCAVNQRYWVFAGGPTPFRFETTVTDVTTGTVRKYVNALGQEARELRDQDAFICTPR